MSNNVSVMEGSVSANQGSHHDERKHATQADSGTSQCRSSRSVRCSSSLELPATEAQETSIEDTSPAARSCCAGRCSTPVGHPALEVPTSVAISSCGDHACCDVIAVPPQPSTLNDRPIDASPCYTPGVESSASIGNVGGPKTYNSSAPLATSCCASDDCKTDSAIPATVLEARRLLQICCELCWGTKAYACCHSACCATTCCLLDLHAKMKSILNRQPLTSVVDAAKDDRAKQHKTSLLSSTDELLLSSPQSSSSLPNLLDLPVVVTLAVSGFTCTDCASSVEQKLRKLAGVTHVRASAMTGQTEVTYNPSLLKSTFVGAGQQSNAAIPSSSQDFDDNAFLITQVEQLGFSAVVQQATVANTLRFLIDTNRLRASLDAGIGGEDGAFLVDKLLARAVLRLQCEPGVITNSVTCQLNRQTHQHSIDLEYNPDITGARVLLNLIAMTGCPVALDSSSTLAPREDSIAIQRRNWRRRWWFSALFCLPVVIIAFIFPAAGGAVGDAFSHELASGLSVSTLVLFLLATPIQFAVGWPLYDSAYRALRYGHNANADTLVMLSTSIAYFYSIIATICALAGSDFTGLTSYILLYDALRLVVIRTNLPVSVLCFVWCLDERFFETSAIVLTLIVLGRYLEALAKGETGDVIRRLVQIAPTTAILLIDSIEDGAPKTEEVLDINLIQRGDVIKVLPGTRIPTDGKVVFGASSVDQSLVTGESAPVPKRSEDLVYSGTLNQHGLLHVRVTRTSAENTLSSITKMVQEAQNSKPPIERIADKIASYFVPFVLVLSVLVFVVWLSLAATGVVSADSAAVTFALRFGIATLVISCPCAIGLAVPTAVMAGTGVGAKHGVLFKSGAIMERCAKVDAVVFDKTGTLTEGHPRVSSYVLLDHDGDDEFWFWLGCAESASEHPLAQALVQFSKEKLATADPIWRTFESPGSFSAAPGKGVKCVVDATALCIGTFRWIEENGVIVTAAAQEKLRVHRVEHEVHGETSVYVALDGKLSAILFLADAPRAESKDVITQLRELNIDVWMCSGDAQSTATAIGSRVGLAPDRTLGGQLPQDKLMLIRRLQSGGKTVAMVGDGINDSPSLAQADVGIAVAQGTDIAAEAADIMLMKSDLQDVVFTIHLSRRTLACIKWNFTWAFMYNLLAVPIAMGVYYPAGGVAIPPALAGLSELLSSLPVVLFSLCLRYYKPHAPVRGTAMHTVVTQ